MDRARASLLPALAGLMIATGGGAAEAREPDSDPSASVVSVPTATGTTTLRTLIGATPEAPTLTIEQELPAGDGHASAIASYESDGLTIYGLLHTPEGDGPHPGVVLVHGLVDPDTWSAMTEYVDFQRRLIDAGYSVFVPDLRNHGRSDDDPDWATGLEVGTTLDAINAARALAAEPTVDTDRVAVIGHSLGGAIALNALVVAPDVAHAFVAMAPSHASPWENLTTFVPPDALGLWTDVHGTPDDNPDFWSDVSALTFVDRADAPLLVVQGTADDVVPPEWADIVRTAWTDAGKDIQVVMIEGGDHVFAPAEDEAWTSVLTFLEEHLGA